MCIWVLNLGVSLCFHLFDGSVCGSLINSPLIFILCLSSSQTQVRYYQYELDLDEDLLISTSFNAALF